MEIEVYFKLFAWMEVGCDRGLGFAPGRGRLFHNVARFVETQMACKPQFSCANAKVRRRRGGGALV